PGPFELTDEEGATWTYAWRGRSVIATFGIPETDATSVSISCSPNRFVGLEFFAAPTKRAGSQTPLLLRSPERSFTLRAQANAQGRASTQLNTLDYDLLALLRSADMVLVTANGQQAGRFYGLRASSAGRQFMLNCPQIGSP
ncbi:MAG: hypothetical protein ACRC7G_14615, partial [Beijerinckiaceae bacterium]